MYMPAQIQLKTVKMVEIGPEGAVYHDRFWSCEQQLHPSVHEPSHCFLQLSHPTGGLGTPQASQAFWPCSLAPWHQSSKKASHEISISLPEREWVITADCKHHCASN